MDKTILVVDDELGVLKLIVEVLSREGYKVLAAASGREALALSGSHTAPIDLALIDLFMPEMNGTELRDRLRESFPAMKALLMSDCAYGEILQRRIDATEKECIFEPFSAAILLNRVRSALAHLGTMHGR